MPINARCEHCGKVVRAPSRFAGRRVKCPSCRQAVSVPDADTPNKTDEMDFSDLAEMEGSADAVERRLAVECASCFHPFHVPARLAGQNLPCPECNTPMLIEEVGLVVEVDRPKESGPDSPAFKPYYESGSQVEQGFVSKKQLAEGWNSCFVGLNLIHVGVTTITLSVFTAQAVMMAVFGMVAVMMGWVGFFLGCGFFATIIGAGYVIVNFADEMVPMAAGFLVFMLCMVFPLYGGQLLVTQVVLGVVSLTTLIGSGFVVVGLIRNLSIPWDSGGKPWAIYTVVGLLATLGAVAATILTSTDLHVENFKVVDNDSDLARRVQVLSTLALFLGMTTKICLIAFLRVIPRYFSDRPTQEYLGGYFRFQVAAIIGAILMTVLIFTAKLPSTESENIVDQAAVAVAVSLIAYGVWLAQAVVTAIDLTWLGRSVGGVRDLIRPYFRA